MKKVILIQLPAAVEQALTEHLNGFRDIEIVCLEQLPAALAAHNPDLVVVDETVSVSIPGSPVLTIDLSRPARLGSLLRQAGQMLAQPVLYMDDIAVGSYIFKPQEKSLTKEEGGEISLTDREVDILAYLVRHRTGPVSRDTLLKNVWKYQDGIDTHTLETHIYRLRQKIEISAEEPRILLTVEGGYSLHLPETSV